MHVISLHACFRDSPTDVLLLPAGFPAGVESFDVSLEQQRVVVRGSVTPQAVLETVAKTGKKAELVQ